MPGLSLILLKSALFLVGLFSRNLDTFFDPEPLLPFFACEPKGFFCDVGVVAGEDDDEDDRSLSLALEETCSFDYFFIL